MKFQINKTRGEEKQKARAMAERPEDLNLPTPIVSKLINDCLPKNCRVSDEAKVAITKVLRCS